MNIIFTSDKETYKNIRQGTEILLSESDIFTENIELSVEFQDRPEMAVSKNGNQIHVICREAAHYYRALNYVLHHMEDKTFQYQEHIYFERNGLMLDCSRNAVFTVEKVKFLIRILAKLGMNVLMLYTEDTYEVKSEPYFGAYRGKYTRDEIKEIDTYAAMFGIELVPCIQTLAHLHNALKWPEMSKIRDSADILQPGKEETYQFIEKLLISVKENFSTSRVHLGMDEAVMLGLGNSLRENGYKEGSLLIREHCERVMDICKTLGLKPMIWSDMYITANTRGGYYDVPENADCSQWEKPDRNLGLVYWDYYHDDIRDYEKMLDIHEQLSDNIIFAGGSWIWNGISPNYSKTFACTNAALGACKEYDMKEVLCTAWMDNGAETPVDALLPGVALFAHLGFHKEELEKYTEESYSEEIKKIIATVKSYAEKYETEIPVIVAGGIYNREDVQKVDNLGADGIQVATRFITTEECDADIRYKEAHLKAKESDIAIVKSPVGMPGRAIMNKFMTRVMNGEQIPHSPCHGCLVKCSPKEIPYCITDGLINAVKGNVDEGLLFCGAKAWKAEHLQTVQEVINDLF